MQIFGLGAQFFVILFLLILCLENYFVTKNQHFLNEPGCIWAANGWRPASLGPRPLPAADPGTAGPPTVAERTGPLWSVMDYYWRGHVYRDIQYNVFECKGYL